MLSAINWNDCPRCTGICSNAAPQRLHEVDRAARHGPALFWLRRHAGLFGLKMCHQRLLITIPEGGGIEGRELAVENVRSEPEQLRRRRQLRDVGETVLGVAHFMLIAQGCPD